MATDVLRPPTQFPWKWLEGGLLGLLGLWLAFTQTTVSNPFNVDAQDAQIVRAFPGCEGFGCETTHGRNGVVCVVDSLSGGTVNNTSGQSYRGSLKYCLEGVNQSRMVVFNVSGIISINATSSNHISLGEADSNVAVFGQTAPGHGIQIRGNNNPAQRPTIGMSKNYSADSDGSFHDALFQYLRWRHSSTVDGSDNNAYLWGGTYMVVIDHNEFIWAPDQNITIYGRGHSSNSNWLTSRDITISRTIFGEGWFPDNGGLFISGGSSPIGQKVYNLTVHNNLYVHSRYRSPKIDVGSQGDNRGAIFVNNVHFNDYNLSYTFGQTNKSGCSAVVADVIGDYFKAGPNRLQGQTPFLMEDHSSYNPPSGCAQHFPASLHLVGSTRRDINGNSQAGNDEANNYATPGMLAKQYGAGPGWTVRNTPMVDRPTHEVTVKTFQEAYDSVVIDEDVGVTRPVQDTVTKRLVDDPEDGDGHSNSNVAQFPTYPAYTPWTDADSDGVPDSYEQTMLNANPACNIGAGTQFDLHAQIDCDNDGYKNVEDWAHSLEIPRYQTP